MELRGTHAGSRETEVSMNEEHPRQEIEEAVLAGDLRKLLVFTGMLHGHYCPFSSLGVKAGARAMREMDASSKGMEELVAIVETNNCFSDGVQIVTGCSFGNNALIFRDYGKTAFTLCRRNGEGFRVVVLADRVMQRGSRETRELFEKVIVQRAGSEQQTQQLRSLWKALSFELLEAPDEEVFEVRNVTIEVPAYARIFASSKCSVCGEGVMEPRARLRAGEPICLACSDQEFYQLAGNGITTLRGPHSVTPRLSKAEHDANA
jgi:formylmethanofuran dehydrogenase subunit E